MITAEIGIKAGNIQAAARAKTSSLKMIFQIPRRLFMKSLATGNTSLPAPFAIPHAIITATTTPDESPEKFFKMVAQVPIKTKPIEMFRNMNIQDFQKNLSFQNCLMLAAFVLAIAIKAYLGFPINIQAKVVGTR